MRVTRILICLLTGVVLFGQISSVIGQDLSGLVVDVSNMGDGSISQARLEAQRQARSGGLPFRSFRRGENRTFVGQYTPPELPEDKKDRFIYGLALFSDDGCNVTLKGSSVHARFGRGQHLPNLGQSFHVLPVALAPSETVDITIDYRNTIYAVLPGQPPDIDGLTLFLYLIPAAIAVDANRDGDIVFEGDSADTTSSEKPFSFWINDDQDGTSENEREVVPTTERDYADKTIHTLRDLEDFARIHIRLDGLHEQVADGTFKIGLKFSETNGGTSKINVYKSTDPDGSNSYLTDQEAALAQISGKDARALGEVTTRDPLMLPRDFWTGSDEENATKCLLFEGSGEGQGELVLTIHQADGTQVAEAGSCWLNLKGIKKMYQRYDGSGKNQWGPTPFENDPSEEANAIVFVHGWRMSPEGASNFAETFYKRLWHRGFKGRFGAFRWDTYWSNEFGWLPYAGEAIDSYLAKCNESEHNAWLAGSSLASFINSLPVDYSKNIAAHSMGNIVVGSALLAGVSIQNYALMQAAVPAACYDEDEGRIRQTSEYNHLIFTMWDELTPDNDEDPAVRAVAYRGQLKNVGGNLVNFFLPEDYATSFAWEINNDQTKPPNGPLAANFRYNRNDVAGTKLYKYQCDR